MTVNSGPVPITCAAKSALWSETIARMATPGEYRPHWCSGVHGRRGCRYPAHFDEGSPGTRTGAVSAPVPLFRRLCHSRADLLDKGGHMTGWCTLPGA